MRSAVIAVLLLAAYCEARPSVDFDARPLFGSSYIVGGENAQSGEFPWQLSQQRLGSSWSHSCGASLLSARYALSAAHCVDGASVSILRVIAGLHDRTASTGVTSNVASYKTHETYGRRSVTFSDDIAILTLATPIAANGDNIQYATLPADNSNQFVGYTGIISGWGRTSSSNALPLILQKATIGVISTDRCNQLIASVSGANVDGTAICLYDEATQKGSCNGDSGGPFNLNRLVAGVTSWGVSSFFGCLQTFPSVYTRTSAYLAWIATNTP